MIPCQRDLFDIPDSVTYLNCAYMSPLMKEVAAAGHSGMDRKMHPWGITSDHFFTESDGLRAKAAELFHCKADDVAIVPAASYGIETAAANLPVPAGAKILVLAEQFPSNYYPWQRLARERGAKVLTVGRPKDGDWTSGVLRHLDSTVAIAALPHTQWTTGGLLDLDVIGDACRRHETALVLDLTQSLGVYPFDVRSVQPDFAVAATYKWLLGPYSLGVLYVAPHRQEARPLEEGWAPRKNAEDFAGLIKYTSEYAPGARRFDVGERSNFALIGPAGKAIEQLLAWGIEEISDTIKDMTQKLVEALLPMGFSAVPDRWRAPHYLCLTSEREPPRALAGALAARQVWVSVRGSSIRVTPHVYNTPEDLDRFIEAMRTATR
jgi:selenocysteine lyase/cysteine desulfurase